GRNPKQSPESESTQGYFLDLRIFHNYNEQFMTLNVVSQPPCMARVHRYERASKFAPSGCLNLVQNYCSHVILTLPSRQHVSIRRGIANVLNSGRLNRSIPSPRMHSSLLKASSDKE